MPLLLALKEDPAEASIASGLQLLEEAEYAYEVDTPSEHVRIEPTELFDPTTPDARSGRLRPKRATGTVAVQVQDGQGALIGRAEFDVRSRKLDYLTEYRWMLQRIASEAAEVLQSEFAASALPAFSPSAIGSVDALYQRFAFIQSLLGSGEFRASLEVVLRRPHQEFREVVQRSDPQRGVRPSRSLARQLAVPGPRRPVVGGPIAGLTTLPLSLEQAFHVETYDTVPNRFLRFALERWRDIAYDVALLLTGDSPAHGRGRREASVLSQELDRLLQAPLFREVGQLDSFPGSNTVLHGRPGYRDVLRAFIQTEAAALVDWSGGSETVFSAGQRDVATLYEYWVFFELLRIVEQTGGFQISRKPIFRLTKNRMSLELRKRQGVVLCCTGIARGRAVTLELWFNRTFSPLTESWTIPLRPDCSLRIAPAHADGIHDGVWLHFDAKYRIHRYTDFFRDDASLEDEPEPGEASGPVPTDLLKMHAYRDAIRRTSGAFVLHPGTDREPLRKAEYHEILPGLGAFVLRPTQTGRAADDSSLALRRFIEDVVDHVAAEGTDEARANYWVGRTYHERRGERLAGSEALTKPPADTRVLLGFVRSSEHRAWVSRTGLYNLRADGRVGSIGLDSPELASDFICLYSAGNDELVVYRLTGSFAVKTRAELSSIGYPNPRGELYCCVVVGELVVGHHFGAGRVRAMARRGLQPREWGRPRSASWLELVAERPLPQ